MLVGSPSYFARLALLVGSGFLFLFLQQGGLAGPVRSAAFQSLQPGLAAARVYGESWRSLQSSAAFIRQGGSRLAAAENELARGRIEAQLLGRLEKENQELRAQLGRQREQSVELRFYGGGGYWFIDGGCRQGLAADSPVYYQGSLLGQVKDTAANFSAVSTILDQSFRTPVKIGTSSATGLFQNSRGVPEILALPLRAQIQPGEMVITRGLGPIPPDVPLGRVLRVEASAETGTARAQLEPFFRPDQIEWVEVPTAPEDTCAY